VYEVSDIPAAGERCLVTLWERMPDQGRLVESFLCQMVSPSEKTCTGVYRVRR
jgi:hypothetical protein